MFKNPLKYQQGGQTVTTQQQEQLVQLFQIAAQNAQVDPQALVQKAQELGQDKQAAAQFMEGLQKCAQGDPAGIKFIQDLFKQPAYKQGGKIHDFICKHANGGKAGCGCNKSVEKAQEGVQFKAPTNYYNEKGWQISENDALRRNNRTFYTEEPTTVGNLAWTNNQMSNQLVWPGIIQDIQYNQPVGHYIDEYGNMHNFAVEGDDLARYNNRKTQWTQKNQLGGIVNSLNQHASNRKPIEQVSTPMSPEEYDRLERIRAWGRQRYIKNQMERRKRFGTLPESSIKLNLDQLKPIEKTDPRYNTIKQLIGKPFFYRPQQSLTPITNTNHFWHDPLFNSDIIVK